MGTVACEKFYKADKKFTIIGLTSLNNQPMICIVIIYDTKYNKSAEIGIDILIDPKGNPENSDFFVKNSGPDKME